MDRINIIPTFISTFFKRMPDFFRGKHQMLFIWLILLIACGIGDYKLTTMACYGSGFVTEWRFRRLLSAFYWDLRPIFTWFLSEIIKKLPIPEDKTLYVIGDGSKKEKRSKKNPYMQKGKIRTTAAWFFGIRFCVLMIAWGNYRIPVDFRILYPKKHKKYRNGNKLFRDMLKQFTPPFWAKQVIIMGDTAYASVDNMAYIKNRAKKEWKENKVSWWFVFSISKTWKFSDGKSLRDLGPKNVKVIVTNLPNVTSTQILSIYQRRFMIEVLFRELKSGMGLGKMQVTKDENRIEKSIGLSILAYLLILKMQHKDISDNQCWSIFSLREKFRHRVMKNQFNHDYKLLEGKLKNAA